MGIEQGFHLDTSASRHDLRDALVRAGIGLEALPDFEHISQAASRATLVTIIEKDDPALGAGHRLRPDNGVLATRSVWFSLRDPTLSRQYNTETVRGVIALLKAYPDADAYLLLYDAAIPALLYRNGRLVLAEQLTRNNRKWDAEHQPYRALVDLPYTIAPLGPWPDVPA
ncbi:hypothetical protein [Methylorubrum podarium]|jgi:hypothetical protein|uniref:hypothetical protein n=1 Tax=Methylorubrum podarium TaxID=200476 RepID=UPI001EE2CECA|nr:hypothetical protein [Methylorubrum podarium]GJE69601.1 hypothetical protein CHKEEEPN_1130 [Methylorubrum podarium]